MGIIIINHAQPGRSGPGLCIGHWHIGIAIAHGNPATALLAKEASNLSDGNIVTTGVISLKILSAICSCENSGVWRLQTPTPLPLPLFPTVLAWTQSARFDFPFAICLWNSHWNPVSMAIFA